MRSLQKLAEPVVLQKHGDTWRKEYIGAVQAKTKPLPSRWRHEEIRSTLASETSGRCAYCEGPILAVSFGDIEHYRPRKTFPSLVVDWSNLTLACQKCNNEKRDKWQNDLPFVNPYFDEIEKHIVFVGAVAWGVSPEGMWTVQELGLNALSKVQARNEQIDNVMRLFQLWSTSDARLRDAFETQLRSSVLSGGYTASVKSALRAAGFAP